MSYFHRPHPALVAVGMVDVRHLGVIQPPSGDAMLVDHSEVAFFGPVFSQTPVSTGGVSVGAANPETEVWARNVVLEALKNRGFENPSLGTIQIVQAVGRLEGFYGKAGNPPQWAGSNNWGAVQCCVKKGEEPCPANTFASKDYDPNKAADYIACFKKYPTPLAGCEDMLRIMTKTEAERKALLAGDILAVSTAMYDAHYYQSRYKSREEAIAYHASTIAKNIEAIRAALGEKLGTGPSVSPVKIPGTEHLPQGPDLTPLLLGLLPIAGFGAARLLVHMVGDPLIVTPEMAREKCREVDANYNRTDDDYAKAISKKKITLAAYKEWTDLYSRWHRWSEHRMGSTGDGISPASASVDYEEAKRYDLQRYDFVVRLEKAGLTPPDRPPEKEPPKLDPDGVLGGGNPLASAASSFGMVAAVVLGLFAFTWIRR